MKKVVPFIISISLFVNCTSKSNTKDSTATEASVDFLTENLSKMIDQVQCGCSSTLSKDSIESTISYLKNQSSANIASVNLSAYIYFRSQEMYPQLISICKEMLASHNDVNVLFTLGHAYNKIFETDSAAKYFAMTRYEIDAILFEDSLNNEALLADVLFSCEMKDSINILNAKIMKYCELSPSLIGQNNIDMDYIKTIRLNDLKATADIYKLNYLALTELKLRGDN